MNHKKKNHPILKTRIIVLILFVLLFSKHLLFSTISMAMADEKKQIQKKKYADKSKLHVPNDSLTSKRIKSEQTQPEFIDSSSKVMSLSLNQVQSLRLKNDEQDINGSSNHSSPSPLTTGTINPIAKTDIINNSNTKNETNITGLKNNYSEATKQPPAHLNDVSTLRNKLLSQLKWGLPAKKQKARKKSLQELRSPRWISKVINGHNSEVQECYQNLLKLNPSLRGKMVVRIFVSHLGIVTEVQIVTSTVRNKDLEIIVVKCIAQWDDFGACEKKVGERAYIQEYMFGE